MSLRALPLELPGPLLLEPELFPDDRGLFLVAWSARALAQVGIDAEFVQDNVALSRRGVLRGLHVQREVPQAKLVRALRGRVYDVVVDVRPGSPSFGRWAGCWLDDLTHTALWIPEGFAHGYWVESEVAIVHYKVTAPWHPPGERVLRWDDPALGVRWPFAGEPLLSARDAAGGTLGALAA